MSTFLSHEQHSFFFFKCFLLKKTNVINSRCSDACLYFQGQKKVKVKQGLFMFLV